MKNNFSKNLKNLRIDNDIKQSEIAKLLNISQGAYAKYENGQREPNFDTLLKISKFFNVSIDDLLNDSINSKINNILNISINYKKSSDILTPLNLIEKLKRKKEFYLKEKNKLENLLNKHIPARISEIDNVLEILEKSNLEISDEITGDFLEKYEKYLYNPIEILTTDFFGAIPCGTPIDSSYEFCDRIDIPLIYPLKENADYFVLRASGDSMDEFIYDGEYLVIERNTNYNNGDIVVALVNGHNTLKEFYSTSSHLILKPRSNNPIHKEQIYQLPADIKIQGKYICKLDDLNNTYEKILEMQNSL